MSAVILTYHGVGAGTSPLLVTAPMLASHLDTIVASGARAVTLSELAAGLADGPLNGVVAITFDDALASVAEDAAPLLAARGLPATVFAVAGRLGGWSDWPSARPGSPRLRLATAEQLTGLAAAGWEIGAHGMEHAPLVHDDPAFLETELRLSRERLEAAVETSVRCYAYPYGALPSRAGRAAVEDIYETACTTRLGTVGRGADRWALPRVEAYYLRRPNGLRRALTGRLDWYLRARRYGAAARRTLRQDYVVEEPVR